MRMEFDHQEHCWLFTDDFGTTWQLIPTGDESMPLIIAAKSKSRGSFNVNADRPSQSSRLEPSVRDAALGLTRLDLPVREEA